MPLYNVMERGLRLPRIGTIRKGIQVPVVDRETGKPKKNGKGEVMMYPKEMPHFVFHVDPTQEADVFGILNNLYGKPEEIKELNVFLAKPDAFSNWSAWQEAYNFNQLIARSDERHILYLFDTESNEILIKDGVIVNMPSKPNSPAGSLLKGYKVGDQLPYQKDMIVSQSKGQDAKAITFKAVGRLEIIVKEVCLELQRLVTFTVITGSYWYDIPSIQSAVTLIDEICKITGKDANTIPLLLRRVEREHPYTDKDGQKKRKVSHDIELELQGKVVMGLLQSYNDNPFANDIEKRLNSPRVEALALPMGEPVENFDGSDEVIESEPLEIQSVAPAKKTPPAKDQKAEPVEMINPMSVEAVKWAAQEWNISQTEAAKSIGGNKKFKNPMPKAEFKKIVAGG